MAISGCFFRLASPESPARAYAQHDQALTPRIRHSRRVTDQDRTTQGCLKHDEFLLERFHEYRHCEERSDEAVQLFSTALDCFAPLAMTENLAGAAIRPK